MALKRVALEIGMGTDIRGADYTKAAVRALRDALWHNSLTVASAVGKSSDDMQVEVLIGVPQPDKVDKAEVLKVLPHGTGTVKVMQGGLEIMNEAGTDRRPPPSCGWTYRKRAMTQKRVILELGTGNDLHGGDYTKAALRAVQDALHHSSLAMLRALKVNPKTSMFVNVTIGVQQPDKVDLEKVKASLPHGIVTVKAVKGGLDIADPENNDPAVIASAAVEVKLELA